MACVVCKGNPGVMIRVLNEGCETHLFHPECYPGNLTGTVICLACNAKGKVEYELPIKEAGTEKSDAVVVFNEQEVIAAGGRAEEVGVWSSRPNEASIDGVPILYEVQNDDNMPMEPQMSPNQETHVVPEAVTTVIAICNDDQEIIAPPATETNDGHPTRADQFTCDVCFTKFSNRMGKSRCMKKHVTPLKSFGCSCGRRYDREDNRNQHCRFQGCTPVNY